MEKVRRGRVIKLLTKERKNVRKIYKRMMAAYIDLSYATVTHWHKKFLQNCQFLQDYPRLADHGISPPKTIWLV